MKRIAERIPAFSASLKRRGGCKILAVLAPALALLLGASMDRIGDPRRVDLLSASLLLVPAWNSLIYAGLLVWMFVPASEKAGCGAGLI